jgi:hypothetical protein
MRRPRQNFPGATRRKRQRPYFKLLGKAVIFLVACIFILGSLRLLSVNLPYFKVRQVLVRENIKYPAPASIDASYLLGKNIFAVNLDRESRYLGELYPTYKRVRLYRILPNRLFADFVTRRPLAYVKLYRLFYLSDDLVLFDAPADIQDARLPVIFGMETKIFGPKAGYRYNLKELVLALRIIGELKLNKALKEFTIKKINAADLDNFSFYLLINSQPQDVVPEQMRIEDYRLLEVKISAERLREKMNILAGLLVKLKGQREKIRYIDLRFKDPLIKLIDKEIAFGG